MYHQKHWCQHQAALTKQQPIFGLLCTQIFCLTWFRYDLLDCPQPHDWKVEMMIQDKLEDLLAVSPSLWCDTWHFVLVYCSCILYCLFCHLFCEQWWLCVCFAIWGRTKPVISKELQTCFRIVKTHSKWFSYQVVDVWWPAQWGLKHAENALGWRFEAAALAPAQWLTVQCSDDKYLRKTNEGVKLCEDLNVLRISFVKES